MLNCAIKLHSAATIVLVIPNRLFLRQISDLNFSRKDVLRVHLRPTTIFSNVILDPMVEWCHVIRDTIQVGDVVAFRYLPCCLIGQNEVRVQCP